MSPTPLNPDIHYIKLSSVAVQHVAPSRKPRPAATSKTPPAPRVRRAAHKRAHPVITLAVRR